MPRRPICASAANQAGHGLRRHALVTYQQSALPGWSDAFCGEPTGNGHVAIELNSAMMIIDAVRAGLGIGELPRAHGGAPSGTGPHLAAAGRFL